MKKEIIRRGDIFNADFSPTKSTSNGIIRPVLIVQGNTDGEHRQLIAVVPLTRTLRKNPLASNILIPRHPNRLKWDLHAIVERLRTIDRSRITDYIGHVNKDCQQAIDAALAACVGLENRRSLKGDVLELSLCHQCETDFKESGHLLVKKGWQEIKTECDFCKSAKGLTFGVFNVYGRD